MIYYQHDDTSEDDDSSTGSQSPIDFLNLDKLILVVRANEKYNEEMKIVADTSFYINNAGSTPHYDSMVPEIVQISYGQQNSEQIFDECKCKRVDVVLNDENSNEIIIGDSPMPEKQVFILI